MLFCFEIIFLDMLRFTALFFPFFLHKLCEVVGLIVTACVLCVFSDVRSGCSRAVFVAFFVLFVVSFVASSWYK